MTSYYEIIDAGDYNPYHFLFYMISNFLIADVTKEIVYYYPRKGKFCEEFLSLLPSNFKRHLVKDPSISYTTFMHAIPLFNDTCLPESYALIRQLFNPYCSKTIRKGKWIYIRREGHTCERTFCNEADVTACLKLLGFDTLNLEDYEVKDQIRMVSEAEVVVGAHGAGLSFTVFCNKDAKVVEIFGRPLTEKRHFLHIAHVLGHTISRFQDLRIHDEKKETMRVNVAELERYLKMNILDRGVPRSTPLEPHHSFHK